MPGEFHFLRPEWFFAVFPVLLVSLLIMKKSKPLSGWEKVCDPALLEYQIIETAPMAPAYQTWLRWLIPLMLFISVIALAGPSWSKKEQPVFQKNTPLVIILDLSYSMNTTDIKPSRLERSKLKIMDILQSRAEGQSALIAYAGDTHVVSPLTSDNKTIMSLLPALSASIMPVPGSQMSDALSAAEQLLKNAGMPNGKIIVLTDGVDDQKAYARAAQLKDQAYQVSMIGVGTSAGSPVPSPQQNGFMKDTLGQVVLSKLNPRALEELAQSGGGEFHRLSLDDSDFKHVLSTDSLEDDLAIIQQDDQIEQWIDQGALITLFIIPFALLAFRKGILVFVFALLLIPALYTEPALAVTSSTDESSIASSGNNNPSTSHNFWDYLWKTPDQKGQQAFNQQDYTAAAEHFENNRWKAGASYRSGDFQQAVKEYTKSDDADSWYNKGNALANIGQFPEAINAYDEALKHDPELEDAQANKNYIEELLSKQQQKQEQNQNSQDKDSKDKQQKKSGQESEKQDQQSQDQQNQNGQDQQQQDQNQAQQQGEGEEDQTQADQTGEDQDQTDQNSSEQDENQAQQAAENNQSSSAQDSDQQNEQNQQNQKQQDMPAPDQVQDQQQPTPLTDTEMDESAMQDAENNQSKPPPRDVMSQLSQEQQQSLNQWLQRIPDDPSELLRRKFYMNSQIRQRQQMTPSQSKGNPW